MQPGPDFGNKWYKGQRILEFERQLGGLVVKHIHAEQTAGPAAERAEQRQREFGHAPFGCGRPPFVEPKCEKSRRVEHGQPYGGN